MRGDLVILGEGVAYLRTRQFCRQESPDRRIATDGRGAAGPHNCYGWHAPSRDELPYVYSKGYYDRRLTNFGTFDIRH